MLDTRPRDLDRAIWRDTLVGGKNVLDFGDLSVYDGSTRPASNQFGLLCPESNTFKEGEGEVGYGWTNMLEGIDDL